MSEKHYYQNHAHVINVLTEQYGFEYKGIGNNYEECFHKKAEIAERIYVHPMFCSYYQDGSPTYPFIKPSRVEFPSDRTSQRSQEDAFLELCVHLNKVTRRVPKKTKVALVKPSFEEVMKFNKHVWPLLRELFTAGKISLEDALKVVGMTKEQYTAIGKSEAS